MYWAKEKIQVTSVDAISELIGWVKGSQGAPTLRNGCSQAPATFEEHSLSALLVLAASETSSRNVATEMTTAALAYMSAI